MDYFTMSPATFLIWNSIKNFAFLCSGFAFPIIALLSFWRICRFVKQVKIGYYSNKTANKLVRRREAKLKVSNTNDSELENANGTFNFFESVNYDAHAELVDDAEMAIPTYIRLGVELAGFIDEQCEELEEALDVPCGAFMNAAQG
ncbi:hypothetical protein [Vibrio gangliei]|uniref:hypothetical protein n=1 Tax=Vibrio gangliei TaxID=2077090 RepID=UPI000D0180D4|nr:hypothetical protein [Vibrio gangliei]